MPILERYGTFLRIYDNGGKTMDRYTILPPRWDAEPHSGIFSGVDPRGMSGHCEALPGPHLGARTHINSLPAPVRALCEREWPQYKMEC